MNSVLDDLIASAKNLVDIAGKKTDNVVEVSKLKYQCVQLTSELKNVYEKLGNSVYTMVKSDFDNKELVDSLIEEIDDLKGKIDELNLQIAERRNIRVCPACGYRNEKDAYYCIKCGNKLTCCESCSDDASEGCCCSHEEEAVPESEETCETQVPAEESCGCSECDGCCESSCDEAESEEPKQE